MIVFTLVFYYNTWIKTAQTELRFKIQVKNSAKDTVILLFLISVQQKNNDKNPIVNSIRSMVVGKMESD